MTTGCVKPGSMGTVLWNILSAPSMSREKAGAPRGPLTLAPASGVAAAASGLPSRPGPRAPPVPDGMVATASGTPAALRITATRPAPERRTGRRPAARTSRPRRTSLRASTQPPCCRRGCEAACPPRIPPDPDGTICDPPRRLWFVDASASRSARPLPTLPSMRRPRRTPHPLPSPASVHTRRETPGTPPPTACSPRAR